MKKINENTKVTLTFEQLKKLVKEATPRRRPVKRARGIDPSVFSAKIWVGNFTEGDEDELCDVVSSEAPNYLGNHAVNCEFIGTDYDPDFDPDETEEPNIGIFKIEVVPATGVKASEVEEALDTALGDCADWGLTNFKRIRG